MQQNKFLFLFLCCLQVVSVAVAQDTSAPAARERLHQNFDRISPAPDAKRVYYEQRLYRNPLVGLIQAQEVMADPAVAEFVPLFQGIPLGNYRLGDTLSYTPLGRADRQAYKRTVPFRPWHYKLDFWLQPQFVASFGNFEKPVQSNTSLLLLSQLYLYRGLVLNGGVLFPLVHELDNRPKIIRPAPLFLNQFLALQNHHFVSASAGFFYNDQYGLNIQYRHMPLDRPFSFGAEAGLTGMYYYTGKGVYYGQVNKLLLLADVAYRLSHPDLTLKLSGGQYLQQDKGLRLDIIRQFSNVEVGLYAINTQNGATLGFNFALSLPPGKILQGKHARLRTDDEFVWEYSYSGGYNIGQRYRTGYQLDRKLRQYHEQYLQRQYQQYQELSKD
ncbi:exopolysaccharide biosynthesis protein YbjH [Pontibacter ummariensis]|uniref:Exopolysaccharide biosynthesis protein YbjH n=1 Tax=Pontibacter ummariensis TaxID=1610492 RepID=A0A239L6U3_9BACT|nr:YjbH domain-containing protein [Pontibacter ummariensis]PRY03979.1 exopolysaccharide biosynthesis protein YbjH [Pontibacter ummariensis]SNT26336.1 Exopolysaccharide biosynthesis protein YbjH [Pontibacter ummariensis]